MLEIRKIVFPFVFLFCLQQIPFAFSKEVITNEAEFTNPPSWITQTRVNHVVQRIQGFMEWDIRKVKVIWYTDQTAFQKFHGYDSSVLAVSRKSDHSIHLGPRVTENNFDQVFGHELVHIILFQKFGDAIPKWLEEGLANYVAKQGTVDYTWLASQPVRDIRTLVHPFQNVPSSESSGARYHYQASTALIEMIAAKCSLRDLLQLSVGEKLESYLSTFCELGDINAEFQKWIKKKH